MARPRMEGMTYFPHDTDASNDEKIEALRALHGNDGYAFYFIICERVYRTPEAELNISHPAVLSALINKIGVSRETFEKILQTAFDVGCFDKAAYEERCVLTSNGIKKRANDVKNMRERWRNSKSKENDVENIEENNMENYEENYEENPEENAEETGESKVNKSKVKENKNKINRFIPPTLKEVEEYCLERQNGIDPQRFIDFYEARGWMIGKNKMKDWKAAVRTWERSEYNRSPSGTPPNNKKYSHQITQDSLNKRR